MLDRVPQMFLSRSLGWGITSTTTRPTTTTTTTTTTFNFLYRIQGECHAIVPAASKSKRSN